jgi:hypothetical protein
MNKLRLAAAFMFCFTLQPATTLWAQGIPPYPNAITDRVVRQETPLAPPPANVVFNDPDFGSQMVRATDDTTDFKKPGSFLRNPAVGETNPWSVDDSKFYVISEGGVDFAFAFDPSTMFISSLPGATTGKGLPLPLRPGATFSSVDPDLIYGTITKTPLTISSYRFSNGALSSVVDTTLCQTQPPLDPTNPKVLSDDDVTVSAGDARIAISEGGPQFDLDMFVVVYDQSLGCRWYNTQTGQIGGQWGATGNATASGFLIEHAYLAGSGTYVKINVPKFGFYVWDLATLSVIPCPNHAGLACGQYGITGNNSFVNQAGSVDEMNLLRRPLSDLAETTELVSPLPTPHTFGQIWHFTWMNSLQNDNAPVCGTLYNNVGSWTVTRPFDSEIACVETDGAATTVWRFAHHRAFWISPFFNTQPLGNVSPDGHFLMFTSAWDAQLGNDPQGNPRSDVWIVNLN